MMKEELIGNRSTAFPKKKMVLGKNNRGSSSTTFASERKSSAGFSTLEMLIAFAVMTLSITAVILVSFGNQSATIDTELANEALYIAESELEHARANTIKNFILINSTSTPALPDELFNKSLVVSDISECAKRVTSEIAWQTGLRDLNIALTSVFTSQEISEALGGDCGAEELGGNWDSPDSYEISNPIHGDSKATDIDVVKRFDKRFALMTSTKVDNQDTFWVIDVSDPENEEPVALGSYSTEEDLNAVDGFVDESGIIYAFTVSASTTAQLQIFRVNIDDIVNPIQRIAIEQLPNIDPEGDAPEGISVYYYDSRVFIGTKRTGGMVGPGHEFHVFDVSNPSSPNHIGSLELNHHANDIVVSGSYAYIASSAEFCELIVVDVSDLGSMVNPCPAPPIPSDATVFDADDSASSHPDGTSVYVLGNRVYLGRVQSGTIRNFYVLDISDLESIQSLASINLNLKSGAEVVGLIIRGSLAFVVTNDTTPSSSGGPFMVYNIENPEEGIFLVSCAFTYSDKATGFDFVGDLGFVSNESDNALRIIYDSPDICVL